MSAKKINITVVNKIKSKQLNKDLICENLYQVFFSYKSKNFSKIASKGANVDVNKDKKETKIDKLEFNTYCIFTEEK